MSLSMSMLSLLQVSRKTFSRLGKCGGVCGERAVTSDKFELLGSVRRKGVISFVFNHAAAKVLFFDQRYVSSLVEAHSGSVHERM